jgi:hypothetical protein
LLPIILGKIANLVVVFPKELSMPFSAKGCYLLLAFLLLLPFAAFAGDIQINGVCVVGTCPPPSGTSDALQLGGSNSGSSSNGVFVNGDPYAVSWFYADSFPSGTQILISPTVTYTGSTTTTTTDLITFNFFQNYYSTAGSSWNGSYTETVPLSVSAGVGSGSSATGELFYTTELGGGGGLGLVTQTGAGSTTVSNTLTLSGLTGFTLEAEYEFTFEFNPGTTHGSSESSPVPEPAETSVVALALVGLVCGAVVARRRSGSHLT